MAEEHDQEKTLPATPRRLEQAREEGQVVRSREFTSAALMVSAAAGALWGGQAMSGLFSSLLARGLNIDRKAAFDMPVALDRAAVLALDALVILLPALGLLAAVAMFAPLALGGWLFTTKPLVPNFGRMSPGRWIGQLFSFHGAAELVKSIAKATVITVRRCSCSGTAEWTLPCCCRDPPPRPSRMPRASPAGGSLRPLRRCS